MLIIIRTGPTVQASSSTTTVHPITIWYWYNHHLIQESETITLDHHQSLLEKLIERYISTVSHELTGYRHVMVQAVALSPDNETAYISFDQSPVSTERSTLEQCYWFEGLLKTIRENTPSAVKRVYFLLNHQHFKHDTIDFTTAWPITGFLYPPSSSDGKPLH